MRSGANKPLWQQDGTKDQAPRNWNGLAICAGTKSCVYLGWNQRGVTNRLKIALVFDR